VLTEEYFAAPQGQDKEALQRVLLKQSELTREATRADIGRETVIAENQSSRGGFARIPTSRAPNVRLAG